MLHPDVSRLIQEKQDDYRRALEPMRGLSAKQKEDLAAGFNDGLSTLALHLQALALERVTVADRQRVLTQVEKSVEGGPTWQSWRRIADFIELVRGRS
jgi:Fic family protein